MQDAPVLRGISPILPVRSVPRAVAFYAKLGFAARLYAGGDDYAFLSREKHEIHLRRAPDLAQGDNPSGLYFYLASGTAGPLEAAFRAAGLQILSPLAVREWQMNEFVLSDPDGNLLRFGEPAEPAAQPPH